MNLFSSVRSILRRSTPQPGGFYTLNYPAWCSADFRRDTWPVVALAEKTGLLSIRNVSLARCTVSFDMTEFGFFVTSMSDRTLIPLKSSSNNGLLITFT